MNESAPIRMADILMPLPTQQGGEWIAWALTVALFLLLAVRGWWYWRSPLRRLARDVRRGKSPPRNAAHGLAALLPVDSELRADVDRLRFRREPPVADEVVSMIRLAGNGR